MSDLQENILWDTSIYYSTPQAQEVEDDFAIAEDRIKLFREKYYGRISLLNAVEMKKTLLEIEDLHCTIIKPQTYAYLLFAADGKDPVNQKLSQKGLELANTAAQKLLFFELEIIELDDDAFNALIMNKHLCNYYHYLSGLRRYRPHTLIEREERLLKKKSLTGIEAFTRLFDELTASFRYRIVLEGDEKEVTGEELLGLLHHPETSVRELAFTVFLNRFREEAVTYSAILNNVALDHCQELELRSFNTAMEPTHLANELSPESVESLMTTTEGNYSLAREYFLLKARILKIPKLKNTDIYAPIGKIEKRYTFSQARDLILESYTRFNPDFRDIIEKFFIDKRIDAFPRFGKSGGAFCMGVSPFFPPYILTNFTGNLRDVTTLAHELGHGLHYVLAQKQSMMNYHPALPIAETASVFGEMLLTRVLLEREVEPNARISLLCSKIEDIIATTFRQNVLTRFEERLHRQRKDGLLLSTDICDLWWEENFKLYSNVVDMIEPYRWGWSYISHFVHSRFYCYSYTFAELLVLALFQKYQCTGAAFVPIFTEILESGGSLSPANTVRSAGIDLEDGGFWQQGYDLLGELIEELRDLL
jgi:oligoendopeptidase F